jgi:phenylpropionate dioxygenase-like ring-hydroxylating dioxygenase large terminal subunit
MDQRLLLPPYPTGWYAIGLSHELARREVRALQFMGRDVVLFRTEAGAACVIDAYCPHLGAHLGYGGAVHGEVIRCPFHGFEFNTSGTCVSIPYGTRIPPKAKAIVYPVCEEHGLILVYFDADGNLPAWSIPQLEIAGWSALRSKRWLLRGHPQETTENSVDVGHFSEIHHYTRVEILKDFRTEGAYLTVKYAMTRANAFLGRPVRAEFEIHAYGLGYSLVEVHVPRFEARARLFVLATPLDGSNIQLRVAQSFFEQTSPAKISPFLAWMPRGFINPFMARSIFNGLVNDVQQDFVIWQHKRYVQPPILAEGDGPVGKYRQWARQFYRGAEQTLI